jgi:hypothetical protein
MTLYEFERKILKKYDKLAKEICCLRAEIGSGGISIVNIGADTDGDPTQINTIQYNDNGDIFIVNSLGEVFPIVGGGGEIYSEVTRAEAETLVTGSTLEPGNFYKITDRGDQGILLQATSTNTFAPEGVRYMLVPTTYEQITLGPNTWLGIWYSGLTPVIDDLVIWGGHVWRNTSGSVGSADDDITLNAADWTVVPKASFGAGEYISMHFPIIYDFTNDWIAKQWNGAGNIMGIDFQTQSIYSFPYNGCDVTDWNMATMPGVFFSNTAVAIFNNALCSDIRWNKNEFTIKNNVLCTSINQNTNPVDISANNGLVGGGIVIEKNSNRSGISDNGGNVRRIVGNLNDGAIQTNTGGNIQWNTNSGGIDNNTNTGNIEQNSNNADISSNSNGGNINFNSNAGVISGNTNSGAVIRNSNVGVIRNNSTVGAIQDNSNMGDIESNSNLNGVTGNSNVGKIFANSNDGTISNNSNKGDINSNAAPLGDIVYNSNDGAIIINICEGFIHYNSNRGEINNNSNIGDIGFNSNSSSINDNANNGSIFNNSNLEVISSNTGTVTNIQNNSNSGAIQSNSNTGVIDANKNNGNISDNAVSVGNIYQNSNNGAITNCTMTGGPFDIQFNINNGFISGNFIAIVEDIVVDKT